MTVRHLPKIVYHKSIKRSDSVSQIYQREWPMTLKGTQFHWQITFCQKFSSSVNLCQLNIILNKKIAPLFKINVILNISHTTCGTLFKWIQIPTVGPDSLSAYAMHHTKPKHPYMGTCAKKFTRVLLQVLVGIHPGTWEFNVDVPNKQPQNIFFFFYYIIESICFHKH